MGEMTYQDFIQRLQRQKEEAVARRQQEIVAQGGRRQVQWYPTTEDMLKAWSERNMDIRARWSRSEIEAERYMEHRRAQGSTATEALCNPLSPLTFECFDPFGGFDPVRLAETP